MHYTRIAITVVVFLTMLVFSAAGQSTLISTSRMNLVLRYGDEASITSLTLNGEQVISGDDGICTSVTTGGVTYSSLHLLSAPVLVKGNGRVELRGIRYGEKGVVIDETWIFTTGGPTRRGTLGSDGGSGPGGGNADPAGGAITWEIRRSCSTALAAEESAIPVFHFNHLSTWEGAYQGYGGLAWFYLFNEKLCTYGVHTSRSSFWNSRSGIGLDVSVDAPGKAVAMRYSRDSTDGLDYAITVSDKEMLPKFDSATHRRRYISGRTDVWAPFTIPAARSTQRVTLSYFDFNQRYGRGRFAGLNGSEVSGVLNTIARIGVIDSLHFGANSWHTPYGPICLHEQYIAQLGLAIDDPAYLKGYESCLDFYRDHAVDSNGRVYARWAYSDEDMMPGKGDAEGFYEAQWGILMDSNPDLVSNVADLYDLTGDIHWVRTHRLSCEAVLDWILRRDRDGNGLVEMMTDSEQQKRGSDWIDIIWASYENAFVNAKLYHALVKWAAIERQLGNEGKADTYAAKAAKLKAAFNKPVSEGGFWDAEHSCYVHWIDRDKSIHGRNMVTPVNFMAIAYGICDDDVRRRLILDTIEAQMERENLFFWPLCMRSYAPGEGIDWEWPFPNYENGDLFLSWGSIAVKAYAEYRPDIAVKYIKNVLLQYSKDGLAFQRYGRVKQDGLGDDILSGNSLAIVGLYQSIYGVNPLYNRLLLDPHITAELAGTQLTYRFRGERLMIGLDSGKYSVSNGRFRIESARAFGYMVSGSGLKYFNGQSDTAALQVTTDRRLTLQIGQWGADRMEWVQTVGKAEAGGAPKGSLTYVIHQLKPNAAYQLTVGGRPQRAVRSDAEGDLVVSLPVGTGDERILIQKKIL
jgi:hypothetical protein